jgi:hypothetical protein
VKITEDVMKSASNLVKVKQIEKILVAKLEFVRDSLWELVTGNESQEK